MACFTTRLVVKYVKRELRVLTHTDKEKVLCLCCAVSMLCCAVLCCVVLCLVLCLCCVCAVSVLCLCCVCAVSVAVAVLCLCCVVLCCVGGFGVPAPPGPLPPSQPLPLAAPSPQVLDAMATLWRTRQEEGVAKYGPRYAPHC